MESEFWFGFVAATAAWMTAIVLGIFLLGFQQVRKNQIVAEAIVRGGNLAAGLVKPDKSGDKWMRH